MALAVAAVACVALDAAACLWLPCTRFRCCVRSVPFASATIAAHISIVRVIIPHLGFVCSVREAPTHVNCQIWALFRSDPLSHECLSCTNNKNSVGFELGAPPHTSKSNEFSFVHTRVGKLEVRKRNHDFSKMWFSYWRNGGRRPLAGTWAAAPHAPRAAEAREPSVWRKMHSSPVMNHVSLSSLT